MKPTCQECNGTGYVGDRGPGIAGNREYTICDCQPRGELATIDRLNIEIEELKAIIEAQKEEWGGEAGDKRLSIQDKISAAHPWHTKDHKTYEMALRMVSAKHSKYGLVDLVNYLLVTIKKWEAENADLKKQLAK